MAGVLTIQRDLLDVVTGRPDLGLGVGAQDHHANIGLLTLVNGSNQP
jgi:hypothetical protein